MKIALFAVLVLLAQLANNLPVKEDTLLKNKAKEAIRAKLGPEITKFVSDRVGLYRTAQEVLNSLLNPHNSSVATANTPSENTIATRIDTFAGNLSLEAIEALLHGLGPVKIFNKTAVQSRVAANIEKSIRDHLDKTRKNVSKQVDEKVVELVRRETEAARSSGRSLSNPKADLINIVKNILNPLNIKLCNHFPTKKRHVRTTHKSNTVVTRVKPHTVASTAKPHTVASTAKPHTVASTAKPHTVASTAKPHTVVSTAEPQTVAPTNNPTVVTENTTPIPETPKPLTLKESFMKFLKNAVRDLEKDAIGAIVEYAASHAVVEMRSYLKRNKN